MLSLSLVGNLAREVGIIVGSLEQSPQQLSTLSPSPDSMSKLHLRVIVPSPLQFGPANHPN